MRCYSCEYKQYKKGDQIPASDCPSDCTIIQLLGGASVAYRSLDSSVQQEIWERYPELVNLLRGIYESTFD